MHSQWPSTEVPEHTTSAPEVPCLITSSVTFNIISASPAITLIGKVSPSKKSRKLKSRSEEIQALLDKGQKRTAVDPPVEVMSQAVPTAPSVISPAVQATTPDLVPTVAPSLAIPTVSAGIITAYDRLKVYTRKRPKRHPTLDHTRRHQISVAKAATKHWRAKKYGPNTELVKTPVTELLCMSKTEDGSMFRKRNPTIHPVTYPSSPPKLNKKGGNRPVPATGSEESRQEGEDVTNGNNIVNSSNNKIHNSALSCVSSS